MGLIQSRSLLVCGSKVAWHKTQSWWQESRLRTIQFLSECVQLLGQAPDFDATSQIYKHSRNPPFVHTRLTATMISLHQIIDPPTHIQYPQAYITPPPNGECFICTDVYSTDPSSAKTCRAVRLSPCGHVIGDQCFAAWILSHPEMCTYWNHKLPRTLPPESRYIRLLRWLFNLCQLWDDLANAHIRGRGTEPPARFVNEAARREALMAGRATLWSAVQGLTLLIRITALHVIAVCAFLGVVLGLPVYFGFTLGLWCWTGSLTWKHVFVRDTLLNCGVMCAVYGCLYVIVVACLLLEGLKKGWNKQKDSQGNSRMLFLKHGKEK